MRPSLVAGQSVDLVDDHRAHAGECLPAALGGEVQVEALGRGDEERRRVLDHGGAGARAVVSPVRTATVIGATGRPSRSAASAISASGRSRFCWTSTANALSGETYTTLVRPLSCSPAWCARYAWSIAIRKPARVLPEPVGAATRTSEPPRTSGHPWPVPRSGLQGNGPRTRRRSPGGARGGPALLAWIPLNRGMTKAVLFRLSCCAWSPYGLHGVGAASARRSQLSACNSAGRGPNTMPHVTRVPRRWDGLNLRVRAVPAAWGESASGGGE